MAINYNPKIVKEGLVFCVDSANPKSYSGSGTSVVDTVNYLQGNLNNGLSFNDGYFIFDGVDDYISFPDNNVLDLSSPFCIEIWIYPISVNTIFAKGQYGVHWNYGLRANTVRHNQTDYGSGTGYSVTNNIWQNIVVRYDGTKNQVFKNSVLVSDFTPTVYSPNQGSGILAIGRAGGSSTEYSNMRVSKFCLYNKLLSPQEIKQNFEATRGRFGI